MMPKDCKKDANQTAAYDLTSYAYRNRRDLECNPLHIELCWNCGYVSRPSTHLGIMVLESRNNILNQFNWRLGHQGIITAIFNAQTWMFHNNYITLRYWTKETNKPIDNRKQPGYKTFNELYPEQTNKIKILFSTALNLSLFKDKFTDKKGFVKIIPVMDIDENAVKEHVYNIIKKNGLKFSKKSLVFSSQHRLYLWCFLNERGWWNMNQDRLTKLYTHFGKKLTKDKLWEECAKLGASWQQ